MAADRAVWRRIWVGGGGSGRGGAGDGGARWWWGKGRRRLWWLAVRELALMIAFMRWPAVSGDCLFDATKRQSSHLLFFFLSFSISRNLFYYINL
jgi:hypothetical protein